MKTLIIDSEAARRWAADEVRALAFEPAQMLTIRKYVKKDVLRASQRRLYWLWLTDMQATTINLHAGHTKDSWHHRMKYRFLVPIYERDNPDYALLLASISDVLHQGLIDAHAVLMKHVISETSITTATVSQFAEYLTEIQMFCDDAGIRLRTDDYLYGILGMTMADQYIDDEHRKLVEKGTEAWRDLPDNWLEELRGN
jgi:hypothetical protein